MSNTNTLENLENSYQSILLAYAAGILDEAQDLIVETHIALSNKGQKYLKDYEALGGYLMENDCEPVPMHENALDHLMAKLEQSNEAGKAKEYTKFLPSSSASHFDFDQSLELPEPLTARFPEIRTNKWKTVIPGLKTMDLPLPCKESKAQFMNIRPALKTPNHGHRGTEITLVLNGAFTDETGTYKRGDLVVADELVESHTPVACPEQGCFCMVVTTAPIKLRGWKSVLNPFLRN